MGWHIIFLRYCIVISLSVSVINVHICKKTKSLYISSSFIKVGENKMKKGVRILALFVVLVIIVGSVFSGMVGAVDTSENLTNNTTNSTEETLLLQESWIAQSSDLFKVTVGEYSETADLDQAIKNEYGDDYRLADWNDVLAYSNDIQSWASSIGMEHGDSYLISRDGNCFWSGRRHYFMTRHDHNCPGSFLVHDDIENHFIDLGSWYNLEMHVLCIKTTTLPPP